MLADDCDAVTGSGSRLPPLQHGARMPPHQHGALSWSLPLSWAARDLLAASLLTSASPPVLSLGDSSPARDLRDRLVTLLRCDPPLLIDAALSHCAVAIAAGAQPTAVVSLPELADSLLTQLPQRWLSIRNLPPQHELDYKACDQLRKRFLRLPLSRWLSGAGQWLELVGPPPPLAWVQQWPSLQLDVTHQRSPAGSAAEPWSYRPAAFDLAHLVRRLSRADDLQQRFEKRLAAEKQTALKQFAYGLSHEINNPLANISTRAQTLMRQPAVPDRQPSDASCRQAETERNRSLQRIVDQAMRAHEMTADLMFYAHPPQPRRAAVDVHAVLRSVAQQAAAVAGERAIELVVVPAAEAIELSADRAMLTEAVRSLVRNAIEAIGIDGRITLDCCWEGPVGDDQPQAVIRVADSGPGLTAEAAIHAFDPYYSGREAGRGLGLGLCRVEGIAKVHGGRVQLASGPAGCVARVWIPRSE